jgi:hypothetical protein
MDAEKSIFYFCGIGIAIGERFPATDLQQIRVESF